MINWEDLLKPVSDDSPTGQACRYLAEAQPLQPAIQFITLQAELDEARRRAPVLAEGADADARRSHDAAKRDHDRWQVDPLRLRARSLAEELGDSRITVDRACRNAADLAEGLLRNVGKDLYVAQCAALAQLRTEGLPGFNAALTFITQCLRLWPDSVHPQPDDDDPRDESLRIAVVRQLVDGDDFLAVLRTTVLLTVGWLRLTMRDAEVIAGLLPPDPAGGTANDESRLLEVVRAGVAKETGVDASVLTEGEIARALEQVRQPVVAARDLLVDLVQHFGASRVGGDDRVIEALRRMERLLGTHLDRLGGASLPLPPASPPPASTAPPAVGPGAPPRSMPTSPATSDGEGAPGGALRTREDAQRQIIAIAEFIERVEPTQPAPLFLRRAERLLRARSYFEIVREMTPKVLEEVEQATGQRAPPQEEASASTE